MEKKTPSANSKSPPKAFYEPPPTRKTSAEIINEARLAIRDSQMADNSFAATSIKPLQTKRPFTPRDKERLLFGKRVKNRPPSSFSLKYLQYEAETSIPPTTPEYAASNFESKARSFNGEFSDGKIFNLGVKENHKNIRLPSLENLRPSLVQKKKLVKSTYSLDNLPEENESSHLSFLDSDPILTRNAFSSPQERIDDTEFPTGIRFENLVRAQTPYGRSFTAKKPTTLSQCLLLEPQNLGKIFESNNNIRKFPETSKEISIGQILQKLDEESTATDNEQKVIDLLYMLYENIDKEVAKNIKISSKLKVNILKSLYKYVEFRNEELLLGIARIILALRVTGNNLTGVCKLIFKVSKNDQNDKLFLNKNLLELFVDAIGRSSPLDDAEACVYGYGSIKFLTMNALLLEKILALGILPLMVLHIKLINNAKMENKHLPEQTNHALFQLTGALRNVASDEEIFENFVASKAVQELCNTIDLFSNDLDIVSNVSRIFSIVSTNECCCDSLANFKDIFKVFVGLFEKYPGNDEIIVRLAYTVGNIVANLDNARVKFYKEEKSITCLMDLWRIYLDRTLTLFGLAEKVDCTNDNTIDVMIKIIRVVANIAINPEIGKEMNEQYGSQLIDELLKVLISNPFKKNNELVLSILSTLNNLSFYYSADLDEDVFHIKQIDIMEAIAEYLTCKDKECAVEAMRILGNLSRSNITRNYVMDSAVFVSLIKTLSSEDVNLIKTTIGVFVNLMSDSKHRKIFQGNDGVEKIVETLNNYGQSDWILSMLVCQVLWNYCVDNVNLYEAFSDRQIQLLIGILIDYLDEERIFGISGSAENIDVLMTHDYMLWEEFANVGTNLLEKFENFLDQLDLEEAHLEKLDQSAPKVDSSTNISFSAW